MSSGRVVSKTPIAVLLFAALALQPAQAQTYTVVQNLLTPNGDMIQDPDGNLYGTTFRSSQVFKLDPRGVLTVLYQFSCDDNNGCQPMAGLFRDANGDLYGTMRTGPNTHYGTVFKLDTNNVLTVLARFIGGNYPAIPDSKLVSINGELYGTTYSGGGSGCDQSRGCGTIFKITKSGVKTLLYRFTGGADGAYPQSVIRDAAGNLYGVATSNVTAPGGGTVFRFDTAGVFTVLHTFGLVNGDGVYPVGRLTRDTNGNIHGATSGGGSAGFGVVYRLDANGNETVIHNFFGRGGGANPNAGVLDVGGVLYGTTQNGGVFSCPLNRGRGCGVLYRIGKTGEYTVLHTFTGPPADGGDGSFPYIGGLTLGRDGSIYGATRGEWGEGGTIFKYTP